MKKLISLPSFLDAPKARTRNPEAGTNYVSGFRVRVLRTRPGMTKAARQ
jgi:hypothetical protein